MNKQQIIDKVFTKTYYIGEAKKQENPLSKIIQASKDESDILGDYFDEALNEINFYAQKRLVEVIITEDSIEITSQRPKKEEITKCVDRLLGDYMVEYISYKWLSDNGYNVDPTEKDQALDRLKNCICALAPKVRRRATEMGI